MGLLEKIVSASESKPPRILIYGTSGIGKSTFAAGSSDAVFIQTESGLDRIKCQTFPLAESFKNVIEQLDALLNENHKYKTVVIDTLDALEVLIKDDVNAKYGVDIIEKADGGYGRGDEHCMNRWRQIVRMLDQLRNKKNMIVVLTAHCSVQTVSDPETAAFERMAPKFRKQANAFFTEWCDIVLLATRRFGAARGEGGGERILKSVDPHSSCAVKTRWKIPEIIPLNWDVLWAAILQELNMKENDTHV